MNIIDVLLDKRAGKSLTQSQIAFFTEGVANGSIADYQISAMLMAIAINGMDAQETLALTQCMQRSGETLDLSGIENSCDKHSTGGVGDKTTLIAAPIVAACGYKVAKISGRGLGHTGGTVDKLMSVRGVNVRPDRELFESIVKREGLCVIEQTANLVPADKKMYALRDVTATVDSLPLIVSSVMSKKLAAGASNIVLDVKCGEGAFMKTLPQARELAQAMVDIGRAAGRNMCALITDMDNPLGENIGNALEVEEAMDVLQGKSRGDLYDVSLELAAHMVRLASGQSIERCREQAKSAMDSGAAWQRLKAMLKAMGGGENIELCPRSKCRREITADGNGYISNIGALALGRASVALGAGREKKEDEIDYGAGIKLLKKKGDKVRMGEGVLVMYADSSSRLDAAQAQLEGAVKISAHAPAVTPVILHTVM